jgi:hypothetical protein
MNIDDLVKIPELYEHYKEHQIKDGDDFFSFINKHYGSKENSHHSEDPDNHDDLPFHHNNHHVCVDINFDLPPFYNIVFERPNHSRPSFFYSDPITTFAVNTLYHPPKKSC